MRTLVVSERLSRGSDDGIKNIALAFLRQLQALGHEVLGLSEWEDLPDENVVRFRANRFYVSASLARMVRRFGPEQILYVPWTSATPRSLFRLAALRRYAGGARTALVATQPMPLGRLGRRVARALRPDLVFVQSERTRAILESAGCDTAFLGSGFNPDRLRPVPASDRAAIRGELGLAADRPLLVHVGHLKRERIDPALLRSVLAAVPELQVLIVGSPHTPQDDGLAAELLGMGVRIIREFVPDISRIYGTADVYLFPVRNEFACVGLPLSVIEALACDRPVVSTPFGGLPDLFRGRPGVRFASSDDELAAAVGAALASGPVATRSLVEDLTWERIVGGAQRALEAGGERGLLQARYLASLQPGDPPAGESIPLAPAQTRRGLGRNKIPLLSVAGGDGEDRLPAGAVEQARRQLDLARSEYRACRELLERHDIPTVFTKSAGPFPYESDNMDLLVPPDRHAEAMARLQELGYVPMWQYREDYKSIAKRFVGGELRNIVHFHEEVSWGVEPFLDRDSLWRRSRTSPDDPEIRVLSREEAFLTVTAHAVYENDRIKLGDLCKVRRLLAEPGFDWEFCRSTAQSLGWEVGYDLVLVLFGDLEERVWGAGRVPEAERRTARERLRGTWAGRFARRVLRRPLAFPLPLSLLFTKALFFRKVLANPRSSAAERLRRLVGGFRDNANAVLRVNHQRPYLVSLSGIDGSGKSSLIDGLRRALEAAEVRQRTVWVRGGNSALLQWANRGFRRLAGRGVERLVRPDGDEGEEPRIVNPAVRWLWTWLVAAEQGFLHLTRVRLPLLRGRVVILDRGLLDTIVDLRIRCGDPRVERRLPLRLLARAAGRPDLAWHLQVDPERAYRRKRDDLSPRSLARRAEIYAELAAAWGLQTVVTEGPPEESIHRVVSTTLRRYFESYPRASRGAVRHAAPEA